MRKGKGIGHKMTQHTRGQAQSVLTPSPWQRAQNNTQQDRGRSWELFCAVPALNKIQGKELCEQLVSSLPLPDGFSQEHPTQEENPTPPRARWLPRKQQEVDTTPQLYPQSPG